METNHKRRDYVQTSLPRLTASSVNDLNCPHRFRQLRMEKNWPSREAHHGQAYGEATHEVLREVYMRQQQGEPDLTQIDLLARAAVYRARYPKETNRDAAIKEVKTAVKAVVNADNRDRVASTVANEQFVEVPISHAGKPVYLLSTKLDRVIIDREADQLRVIDYKVTTNHGIDLKAALIMLWAAKLVYPGFQSYVIEYLFVEPNGSVDAVIVEDWELRGIYKLVTDQARKVLAGTDFPTVQGDWCTFCVLRQGCPAFRVDAAEDTADLF